MRQVGVGFSALALIDWAITQFVVLPKMTEDARKNMYAGFASTPYPYLISGALVCVALWFTFSYRGPLTSQGRRLAAFVMAIAAICAMLKILAIRLTWHI